MLWILTIAGASAQPTSGTVDRVIDGDTIVVRGVGTVRLIGIDAPEIGADAGPSFARQAADVVRLLAEGVIVGLEFDGARKDKYDRTLAYVRLADGRLLNAELLRRGYAVTYRAYSFSRVDEFLALEQEARTQRRGSWASSGVAAALAGSAVRPPSRALVSSVGAQSPDASAPAATETTMVYVTKTGTKYHRDGCRHLTRSRIPIALKTAIGAGNTPCAVCKPPTLAATAPTAAPNPASSASGAATPATSGRCQATTKKGARCSRRAQPGRAYCWQH